MSENSESNRSKFFRKFLTYFAKQREVPTEEGLLSNILKFICEYFNSQGGSIALWQNSPEAGYSGYIHAFYEKTGAYSLSGYLFTDVNSFNGMVVQKQAILRLTNYSRSFYCIEPLKAKDIGHIVGIPVNLQENVSYDLATLTLFYLNEDEEHISPFFHDDDMFQDLALLMSLVFKDFFSQELIREQQDRIQQNQHLINNIIRESRNIFIQFSPSGKIKKLTPYFLQLTGYEEQELINSYLPMEKRSHEQFQIDFTAARQGRTAKDQKYILETKHNDDLFIQGNLFPIQGSNQKVRQILLTAKNITKEHKLVHQIDEIHGELHQKEAELEESKKQIELIKHKLEINKQLDMILALVNKLNTEINNPIQAIVNYAEILSAFTGEFPDEQQNNDYEEFVNTILSQSFRISSVLKNTKKIEMYVTRASAKDRSINLIRVFDEMVKKFEKVCQEANIRVVKRYIEMRRANPTIIGRYTELTEAFSQIFKNAIQAVHQKDTGKKEVIVELKQISHEASSYYQVLIQDSGVGIPKSQIHQNFKPFYSNWEPTQKDLFPIDPSLGLGLFIVQVILKKYDARLLLRSKPTKGTRFTIDLPIKIPGDNLEA